MIVMKFGGTSLGSASRMKGVSNLVDNIDGPKIVVLSAVSKTTNALVEIADAHKRGDQKAAINRIEQLQGSYNTYLEDLFPDEVLHSEAAELLEKYFDELRRLISQPFYDQIPKIIVVTGELISTNLFALYRKSQKKEVLLIPAVDFMYLNDEGEPDIELIRSRLNAMLSVASDQNTIVTQGFVCRNSNGGTDNLNRGGSDYSATLIGAAILAKEVQIWTDIDGMHNNDPRVVDRTKPISKLSFEEAGELAYFGAKILHPNCIIPAQAFNVPVRIKNTLKPHAEGTLITSEKNPEKVKAIAAKDRITAIKIKSSRMIMAYGFLRQVFEVFEKYKTPIDMITTSEIAVSLTIDDNRELENIIREIEPFGKVEVDLDQTIICIVGDMVAQRKGVGSHIFNALDDIPLRMISYGGSKNNISLLVDSAFKVEALQILNKKLFQL